MITQEQALKLQQDTLVRESYEARVLVVGGGFQYLKMFFDAGFKGATHVQEADIICFTGGADVDPTYYGEEAIPGTYTNLDRDAKESIIYAEALALQKAMVGICRGSQFLNVMNGGKLWQDVDRHAGRNHKVTHVPTGETKFNMTSTHHQQMRPGKDGIVIAVAEESLLKKSQHDRVERHAPEPDDVEVMWYPDSLCLCFQPHPEFSHGDCRNYFLELLDEYILPAC